jgi:hypothetical protein
MDDFGSTHSAIAEIMEAGQKIAKNFREWDRQRQGCADQSPSADEKLLEKRIQDCVGTFVALTAN